jgi:hypothetical protein
VIITPGKHSSPEEEMNRLFVNVLTALAALLAIGEFAAASVISFPWGAVAIGILFVVGAALLQRGSISVGTMLVGVLCLFLVVTFPSLSRDGALEWTGQISLLIVALAGLIVAVGSFVGRLRLARETS